MQDELDFSEYKSEEDLAGFDYPKGGQYHLAISCVDDTRDKKAGVVVSFQVLAGNVLHQVGKSFRETFRDPSSEHVDGGSFARKKLAKLALALGLAQPSQLGQRGVKVSWSAAEGMQLVATIANYVRKDKDDPNKVYKGAEIDGLHLYRVNDPEVAEVPKDQAALALIQPTAPGTTAPTVPAPTQTPPAQTAAVPPPATGKSWDNI